MQSLRLFAVPAILITSAPVARIARALSPRSSGIASVVVHREHDPAAPGLRNHVVEARTPFDVDILGAERQRLAEDATALLLRAFELAAFPHGPARHDHRPPPALQRAGNVRVADRVETQLDQVGVRARCRACVADLPSSRPVTVTQRRGSHHVKKKAPSTVAG